MNSIQKVFLGSFAAAVVIGGFTLFGLNDKADVQNYIDNGGRIDLPKSESSATGDNNPSWFLATNMPAPTRYHGAGASYQRNDTNWLLCFGGDETGSGGNSSVLSIYNATTTAWSTGASMPPTLVFYTSATRLGNIFYVVGGIGPGGAFTAAVNEVKRYNFATNSWMTNAANYPTSVAEGKCAGYQESLIYVCGGLAQGTSTATANVNLYNASSDTWRTATPLPVAVWGGGFAITGDTLVYVCGAPSYSGFGTNTVYRGI